jgi:hypothetical protein
MAPGGRPSRPVGAPVGELLAPNIGRLEESVKKLFTAEDAEDAEQELLSLAGFAVPRAGWRQPERDRLWDDTWRIRTTGRAVDR